MRASNRPSGPTASARAAQRGVGRQARSNSPLTRPGQAACRPPPYLHHGEAPPFHTRHPATASPGPLCPPSSLARWELPNPLDREPPQHRGLSCRLTATPLAPRTAPAVTGPGRSLDDSISGGLALSVSGAPRHSTVRSNEGLAAPAGGGDTPTQKTVYYKLCTASCRGDSSYSASTATASPPSPPTAPPHPNLS